MSLIADVIPGAVVADDTQVTPALLRKLAKPTIRVTGTLDGSSSLGSGTVQTLNIADAAVTTAKIVDGAVTLAKVTAAAIAAKDDADLVLVKDVSASVLGTYTRAQVEALIYRSGDIKPTAAATTFSTSVDQGWLLCDGSAVSRTTFAALFAAVGTTFGAGDGSTTFNVPDLRGRTVIGSGVGRHQRIVTASAGSQVIGLAVGQSRSGMFMWGQEVTFATTGTLPAPLAALTAYYIVPEVITVGEAESWKLAVSRQNASDGVFVTMTNTGSGVHTMEMVLSSRTLGMDYGREYSPIGKTHMPPHNHGDTWSAPNEVRTRTNVIAGANDNATSGGGAVGIESLQSVGAGNPLPTMSPAAAMRYLVKT